MTRQTIARPANRQGANQNAVAGNAPAHEVTGPDGRCLYRGQDVELACEVYEDAPAGSRLSYHRNEGTTPARRRKVIHAPVDDEPVPYWLTALGYEASQDDEDRYWLTAKGYAEAQADLFVVDTTDVDDLRSRCPELFARRAELGDAS
jgi:hypothetical protein